MTKSEIRDKQICLLCIIFEVASSTDKLWKPVRLNSFPKTLFPIRFNLLQFCPSVTSVVSVVLFWPSFEVLSRYFYVSLGFNGHFVIPNLVEFRDTAPLIMQNCAGNSCYLFLLSRKKKQTKKQTKRIKNGKKWPLAVFW